LAQKLLKNVGEIATRRLHVFPDMSCNLKLAKNYKNVNNPTGTEAREKISTYVESL
jgi:hypothetical protein